VEQFPGSLSVPTVVKSDVQTKFRFWKNCVKQEKTAKKRGEKRKAWQTQMTETYWEFITVWLRIDEMRKKK